MTGAADVAQERDPVGVRAHDVVELRFLAQPAREEAGAQLRLERLAEGVVLRERQRGDEFGKAE
jgi:predicted nuclease with TOPRIM domain